MSEVCWYHVPEDAEFYADGYFRKNVSDHVEFLDDIGGWRISAYSFAELATAPDFELRPVCTPEVTPDVEQEVLTDLQKRAALINLSGGTLVELTPADECKPIKSDGGSSSYYDIQLPDWLINLIVERRYIKTEELIEVLGSDFDLGNIIKCAVRINSLKNGVGKEGNDISYDSNKIIYSANRLKERDKR